MLDGTSVRESTAHIHGGSGVGELVSQLVTEGRALAQAEAEPFKAKATERLTAYKRAGLLFAIAGVLALSALIALLVGLEITLAHLIGPGGATAIVVFVTLLIAGSLGLAGKRALAPPPPPRSDAGAEVARAERDRNTARQRVFTTLAVLQDRLDPRRIARRAARDAADKGGAAVEAARRNPGATAGVTAVAGLFLARHRIAALFRRKRRDVADFD